MNAPRPVTIVTGASAGIGIALAHAFARHGHELVLVARRADRLQALADDIVSGSTIRPLVLPLDLAAPDCGARIDAALAAHNLVPQYVVNNAGFGLFGRAAELDRNEQLAMLDLNVRTLTDLSLRWIGPLARQRGGILNVASVAAFMPGPHMAVYYASKAYVLSFSEALRRELKGRDVSVTVLCPGPVATEFQARAGLATAKLPHLLAVSPERVAQEGYHGLMAGRRLVVPGLFNKVITRLSPLVPRALMIEAVHASQRRRGE